MSVAVTNHAELTLARRVGEYDPLRDSRHRSARAAREVADWLSWLEVRELAPRTRDRYERTLALLLRMFPDKAAADFTEADLFHCLRQYPAASRRHRRNDLKSFFGFCKTMDICELDFDKVPKIKPPGKKIVATFTRAEVAQLCGLPRPDGPLMQILFYTGIRKMEARHLQRRHVQLERRELLIRNGKGGKDRITPLFLSTQEALADWFFLDSLRDDDYLWYSKPGGGDRSHRAPISDSTFHAWWKKCVAKAKVEYHNPHAARHTFAVWWKRSGARLETLRDVLGHANIAITADIYGSLDLSDVEVDVALIEAQLEANKS